MHRPTVATYEREAARYADRRPPLMAEEAAALSARRLPGRPVADLGAGPGQYLPRLPRPALALDAAAGMLALAGRQQPPAWRMRADLEALPVRRGALGGAWARGAYHHVERHDLPLALADLHRALAVGAPLTLTVVEGEGAGTSDADDIGARRFTGWRADELHDVLVGAGFEDVDQRPAAGTRQLVARARRARTLADTVGPGMRLLVVGLNPSVVAADAGVGFAGATNRFWPAALAAGAVTRPRDAWRALRVDRIGMTDLVKRATPGAAGLRVAEYRAGAARVARLAERLRPGAVAFVGLAGYRAGVDPTARPGPQAAAFGGRPAYVLPSTSGANARTRLDELVDHLRAALALADAAGG